MINMPVQSQVWIRIGPKWPVLSPNEVKRMLTGNAREPRRKVPLGADFDGGSPSQLPSVFSARGESKGGKPFTGPDVVSSLDPNDSWDTNQKCGLSSYSMLLQVFQLVFRTICVGWASLFPVSTSSGRGSLGCLQVYPPALGFQTLGFTRMQHHA